jgi:S1-C subfamily serine protease
VSEESSQSMFLIRSRGRTSGPFAAAELQRMVRRGSLSRAHEISLDGNQWMPAADFEELFGGNLHLLAPEDDAAASTTSETNQQRLFYQQNGEVFGPMPGALIVDLARNQKLRREDLIWEDGDQHPVAADVHPLTCRCFATSSRPTEVARMQAPVLSISIVVCGIVLLLTIVGVVSWSLSSSSSESSAVHDSKDSAVPGPGSQAIHKDPSMSSMVSNAPLTPVVPVAAPILIQKFDDDANVGEAVGLVVNGVVLQRDEHIFEMPIATGSCFAVAADGILLTNKHVVESISPHDLRKLRDEMWGKYSIKVTPRIWIFFKKAKYVANVSYESSDADWAVMKVDRRQPFFALSKGGTATRGENVFALGFPGDGHEALSIDEVRREVSLEQRIAAGGDISKSFKDRDFIYSLESGLLSRVVPEEGSGRLWVQHGAVLRHGNSGGPLIDSHGVVLAINTRLQGGENNAPIYSSLEISQFRRVLAQYIPGAVWE